MDSYDAGLSESVACDGTQPRTRLAVYNRQYWFRLFGVFQKEFVVTGRLFGHWLFNDYVARFIAEHPPRGHDLQHALDGFDAFLGRSVGQEGIRTPAGHVPGAALCEAARVDLAFRDVFYAPDVAPFSFAGLDAGVLASSQLVLAPTCALLSEHWPLFALRQQLRSEGGERAVRLPGPHAEGPRHWVLLRDLKGHRALPLEPLAARLYRALCERPLTEALGTLEAELSEAEREGLAPRVQQWLSDSVRLGFWAKLETKVACAETA
jgi:hypothetical protein